MLAIIYWEKKYCSQQHKFVLITVMLNVMSTAQMCRKCDILPFISIAFSPHLIIDPLLLAYILTWSRVISSSFALPQPLFSSEHQLSSECVLHSACWVNVHANNCLRVSVYRCVLFPTLVLSNCVSPFRTLLDALWCFPPPDQRTPSSSPRALLKKGILRLDVSC